MNDTTDSIRDPKKDPALLHDAADTKASETKDELNTKEKPKMSTKTKIVPPLKPPSNGNSSSQPKTKHESTAKESKTTESQAATDADPASVVEDEEIRLAMEMALAAAQNPKLSAAEIRQLVGERNKQAKILEDHAQKKKDDIERKKQMELEQAQKRWDEKKEIANNWWQATSMAVKETAAQLTEAAVKRAEEMKNNAEMRLYADQIKKDPEHTELRKKIKLVRKIYKAHRLNGNRIETRHVFKRQRMEKNLIRSVDKLNKTQRLLTHSSYNVQEYLKALMKASKKWRKVGTDEELMLEAQLCRNMHQMLALEKQKVKSKKAQREMKKYLQRCKGWLTDKKAFCEMNQMTLEATMHSMKALYEDIIAKQDELIARLKSSEEFANIDLSDVDISHVKMPILPSARAVERSSVMRGLPQQDSIKLKKEASQKSLQHAANKSARAELYVTAKDDVSVSSNLSDPDEPYANQFATKDKPKKVATDDDSEASQQYNFGNDAPWMASMSSLKSSGSVNEKRSVTSTDRMVKALSLQPEPIEEDEEEDVKPAAKKSTKTSGGAKGAATAIQEKAAKKSATETTEKSPTPMTKTTPDTSESADSSLLVNGAAGKKDKSTT